MTASQLPAHLQQFQAPDIGAALSQNLGSAMPPHVSIGGGRFTLIDASNNEIPVPTFDPQIGPYLDAVIIAVNPHMSRIYFAGAYDPNAEGTRPDCFSDNGIAASTLAASVPLLIPPHPRAGQPAATCGECPMSIWGSKISNLGKKIPACTQKQKMALLIPGFQVLFLLAVPPNSHGPLSEYVQRAKGSGVNLADVVTRISFVPGIQGTLQFVPSPAGYIDIPTAQLRQAAYAEKKTDALVGRNDVPRSAGALPAPAQPYASTDTISVQSNGQGATSAVAVTPGAVTTWPAQQVQQPGPFAQQAPTAPAAVAANQPATGWPSSSPAAAPTVSTTSPSEPAPAGRRKRRTAAEMQQAQPPNGQAGAPAAAPQAPFPHPASPSTTQGTAPVQLAAFPSATGAPVQPQFGMAPGTPAASDPNVSAQLDAFFKGA